MTDEQNPFAAVLGEIFGRTVEVDPTPEAPSHAPATPGFSKSTAALLEGFGISEPGTRDGVTGLVASSLEGLGLDAEVGSFRFGVLTIDADPVTARLLRFETQRLLSVLAAAHPGEVHDLVVRVKRPRRRRGDAFGAARA